MRGRRFRACDVRGPRGVRRPCEGDRPGLQTRGPGAFLDDAPRVGGNGPRAPRSLPEEVSLPRELGGEVPRPGRSAIRDRKSTRLNSSHLVISYAVFCLKKKKKT